jgi:hypothetical protein
MNIVKNWSLTSVECKLHRFMCKHRTTFSYKQICMMMFILGEVVDTKVSKMLEKAKATGLYDGLTQNSTHYVALYALFIEGEGDASFGKTTHRIIFLGDSPMIAIPGKNAIQMMMRLMKLLLIIIRRRVKDGFLIPTSLIQSTISTTLDPF